MSNEQHTAEPAALQLNDGLGAAAEARRSVRLECRICGGRYSCSLPWQGRPQGPQCQCNPGTWGNWKRVDQQPHFLADANIEVLKWPKL